MPNQPRDESGSVSTNKVSNVQIAVRRRCRRCLASLLAHRKRRWTVSGLVIAYLSYIFRALVLIVDLMLSVCAVCRSSGFVEIDLRHPSARSIFPAPDARWDRSDSALSAMHWTETGISLQSQAQTLNNTDVGVVTVFVAHHRPSARRVVASKQKQRATQRAQNRSNKAKR